MSPRRPPSPCIQPGCPEVVKGGGLCPEHRRARERARGTPSERGYGSKWQRIAARYLRWHPQCSWVEDGMRCGRPATDVDHVVRRKLLLERGVPNPDADEHLQALCHAHHSLKTARETGLGRHH